MKTSRLRAMVIGSVFILILGSTVCAPAAEMPPIKVGVIFSLTGPYVTLGTNQMNGVTLLFEEKNFEVAGRKIKLSYSDDATKPDVGLTKTKELVEFEKVNLLFGYISSAVVYATRDFLHQNKIPSFVMGGSIRSSRDLFSPYIFRCSPASYQYAYEPSKWFARQRGFKKQIWVGANYAGPREVFVGWKKGLEEEGGKIVQEVWPPFGVPDYGPFLSTLKVDEADCLTACVWGADATRFVNQWAEYGLGKRIPLVGPGPVIDEDTLPGMGTNAVGLYSAYIACVNSDVPGNKEFVEAYKKRFKSIPANLAYGSYTAAKACYLALEKVKGNIENKEEFLKAVREVKVYSPMGLTTSFDERQAMLFDLVVTQVKKVDGGVSPFEVGRIKNVRDRYDLFPQ